MNKRERVRIVGRRKNRIALHVATFLGALFLYAGFVCFNAVNDPDFSGLLIEITGIPALCIGITVLFFKTRRNRRAGRSEQIAHEVVELYPDAPPRELTEKFVLRSRMEMRIEAFLCLFYAVASCLWFVLLYAVGAESLGIFLGLWVISPFLFLLAVGIFTASFLQRTEKWIVSEPYFSKIDWEERKKAWLPPSAHLPKMEIAFVDRLSIVESYLRSEPSRCRSLSSGNTLLVAIAFLFFVGCPSGLLLFALPILPIAKLSELDLSDSWFLPFTILLFVASLLLFILLRSFTLEKSPSFRSRLKNLRQKKYTIGQDRVLLVDFLAEGNNELEILLEKAGVCSAQLNGKSEEFSVVAKSGREVYIVYIEDEVPVILFPKFGSEADTSQ